MRHILPLFLAVSACADAHGGDEHYATVGDTTCSQTGYRTDVIATMIAAHHAKGLTHGTTMTNDGRGSTFVCSW